MSNSNYKSKTNLIEQLSKRVHDRWMKTRRNQGWVLGPKRNDVTKHHPSIIPYEDLSEEEKQVDRESVIAVLESLEELGYKIVQDHKQ